MKSPTIEAWFLASFLAAIIAALLSLYAPNAFAGAIAAIILLGARACGWTPASDSGNHRPIILAILVGGSAACYQHYRGLPIPGHWFERGADYSARAIVEIGHSQSAATTYHLPGEIEKSDGQYHLRRVFFKNGGRPNFDLNDSAPLGFRDFAAITTEDGEHWRARIAKDR
jgi:hypothetical protein